MRARRRQHYYEVNRIADSDGAIRARAVVKVTGFRPSYDIGALEGLVIDKIVCKACGETFPPCSAPAQRRHAEGHHRVAGGRSATKGEAALRSGPPREDGDRRGRSGE